MRFHVLFLAGLSLGPLAALADANALFSKIVTSEATGFDSLAPDTQTQTLQWAKEYANFRRAPQSSASQEFLSNCLIEQQPSIFCRFTDPLNGGVTKQLTTPLVQRRKFFKAILSLDVMATRSKNCPTATKQLQSIIEDGTSTRLHARSLYWLWVCAKHGKNEVQAKIYKDELWFRFPFDHHTFLVLQSDKDNRAERTAAFNPDISVAFRSSQENSPINSMIAGLEALHQLKEDGAATVVAKQMEDDIQTTEPEVQLYLTVLLSRVAKAIPSILPVTRILIPLLRSYRDLINSETLQMLFPVDYPWLDSQSGKYVSVQNWIETYKGQIDPGILLGLIYYESALNPKASSRANAFGLLQLLSATANEQYQTMTNDKSALVTREQLYDPGFSLKVGSRVLDGLKHDFDGSWTLALASYNAGESAVQNWIDSAPKMTDPQVQADLLFMNGEKEIHISDYVSTVLGKADWYSLLYFR